MNKSNKEKQKGIIAAIAIILSLTYSVMSIRSRLAPATPSGPSVAAQIARASTQPQVPNNPTAPSTTTATLPPKPFKVVVKNAAPNTQQFMVRDPFATASGYYRSARDKRSLSTPASGPTMMASAPSSFSRRRSVTLPPAHLSLDELPSAALPSHSVMARRQTVSVPQRTRSTFAAPTLPPTTSGSTPAGTGSTAATGSSGGSGAPSGPAEVSYALTGTVEGDAPMAILRGGGRSYLVREGDWLAGDLQVRRITPRQVVLRNRLGQPHVLNLGASPNAT